MFYHTLAPHLAESRSEICLRKKQTCVLQMAHTSGSRSLNISKKIHRYLLLSMKFVARWILNEIFKPFTQSYNHLKLKKNLKNTVNLTVFQIMLHILSVKLRVRFFKISTSLLQKPGREVRLIQTHPLDTVKQTHLDTRNLFNFRFQWFLCYFLCNYSMLFCLFAFFYFSRIINLNAYKNNNNLKNAGTEIDFVSLFFSDLFRWQNNKQTTN